MDKTSVCGTDAPGSTPGGSTKETTPPGVFLLCYRQAQLCEYKALRESKSFCAVSGGNEQKPPKGILYV